MSALDDLAEKIATARAMPAPFGMVVLTADEAQAVMDAKQREQTITCPGECTVCHTPHGKRSTSSSPHDGDDEHA